MIIFPLEPGCDPALAELASEMHLGLSAAMKAPLAVRWLSLRGGVMQDIGPIRIPDELSCFRNLEVLEIEHYSAVRLTSVIAELPALHTIILLGNEFAPAGMSLGRHLADVPHLRSLYVDGFFPLELTMELAAGLPLKKLWIEECEIEGLQYLAAMTQLEELSLDHMSDEAMKAIAQMTELKRLRLFVADQVPDAVRDLKLQTLALPGLRDARLPEWLGAMDTLEELDLCNADLSSLPDGFASLKRLELKACPLAAQAEALHARFPGIELIL